MTSAVRYLPLLVICLSFGLVGSPAEAQQRRGNLPSTGFSTYSGGTGPLPSAGGLHLHEGQDRPAGGPAGVYDPRDPDMGGKLVRWDQKYMPLKVYVSPGLQLPSEPLDQMKNRPSEVLSLLQSNPGALLALPKAQRWQPEMSSAALNGIEQWRELQNEGVIAFEFVDEPWGANILLYWADHFPDSSGPGGSGVHGNTATSCVDVGTVRQREAQVGAVRSAPVIIEMIAHDDMTRLQAEVAHEFGHALGIKAHSPYRQDIMYVHRIVPILSSSDKATLRWLYKQPPQYLLLPPYTPDVSSIARVPASVRNDTGPAEPTQAYRPGQGGYKISPLSNSAAPDGTDDSSGGGRVSDGKYRIAPLRTQSDSSDAGTSGGSAFDAATATKSEAAVKKVKSDEESKEPKKKKRKKDEVPIAAPTKPDIEDELPDREIKPERPTDGY